MALTVKFRKSAVSAVWDGSYGSLLELAEDNGVEIVSECRAGVCGVCKTKLLSGQVNMKATDGLEPDDEKENMILPCVASPLTDLELDA